ncbi:MAG: sigma-54 dependent transcriptional regulator [Acidobacteria bacterium]|nr:sigma-54 dependent transcriptional regulator [Acidobacteriota bacterium]
MTRADAPRVLVVDDEPSICRSCEKILTREGYDVKTALSGAIALDLLGREPFDLVFTDLKMAEMGGMELLEVLRTRFPDVVSVVITGFATIASVVETMKVGAFDYLPKPFTPDEMAAVARKAWERRQLLMRSRGTNAQASGDATTFAGIVGASPRMQEVYRNIRKVATTSSTVLIIGETGTGKELVARAIHAMSPRKHERFFAVDCGALSVTLLESELFGHVKGSFTGAVCDKRGIFESANRGTVFLDEICNVDVDVQAKLLRFIQEREFMPVGSTQTKHVDVRLVFATNRDLERMVRDGTFREDLYYRLYVFPISLPPLRERREDIPLLAAHLLLKTSDRCGRSVTRFAPEALTLLEQFDWPGNVRQLEAVIERAVIACDGDVIEARHLPRTLARQTLPADLTIPRNNREFLALKKRLRDQAVAELEREFVLEALQRNGWNVTRTAADVGIQRPNFQMLMRRHGIRGGAGLDPQAHEPDDSADLGVSEVS